MEQEIKKLTPEEFRNLSKEEQKDFVRKLIHSNPEAAEVHAAFYNPQTKQSVSLSELVEHLGEDEAINLIVEALNNKVTNAKSLDENDIKNLIAKAAKGECTDEELEILNFIQNQMMGNNNHIQFQQHYINSMIDLLYVAQHNVGYDTKIDDLMGGLIILLGTSGMVSKEGSLSKYNFNDVPIITEMCNQIGDDIYDTWKASCENLPDPELIVLGLLHLALKIAHLNDLKVSDSVAIADMLGYDLETDDEDDEENGSNESNDSSSNEDMKDLLKE